MFDAKSALAEELRSHAEKIERTELGLRVIAGQAYCVPYLRLDLRCSFRGERRIKLMEEFILRIGAEVSPHTSFDGAAELLGLDELFIRGTYDVLCKEGLISEGQDGTYEATAAGLDIYQRRVVFGPIEAEDVALDLLPEFMEVSTPGGRTAKDPTYSHPLPGFSLEWLPSEEPSVLKQIEAFIETQHEMRQVAKNRRLIDFHIIKKSFAARPCAVFLVFDTLVEDGENLGLRVIRLETGSRLLKIEVALSNKIMQGQLTLEGLVGSLHNMDAVVAELEKGEDVSVATVDWEDAKLKYRAHTRIRREQGIETMPVESASASGPELLFDHEIRPRFLQMLHQAKRKIVIISPWISETAVDDELLTLLQHAANRGVITLIGWGIANSEVGENRRPPDALLRKLHDILNPQGFPAVLMFWIGNQHRKNILVDDHALLTGSHNLLSYRGDYRIRGEEAIYLTDPKIILQSKEKTASLLQQGAKRAWQRASVNHDGEIDVLVQCCMTWMANEQFETLTLNLDSLVRKSTVPAEALEHLISIVRSRVDDVPVVPRQALRITLETMQHEVASRHQALEPVAVSKRKPMIVRGFLRWRNNK